MNHCRLERFATYEAREEAFRRLAGGLMPRYYGGPRLFWADLRRAAERGLAAPEARPLARVTANPRDCLAFGSPHQVLAAAALTAAAPGAREIEELARRFGIQPLLHQPIRTLSGGETVLVALAKAAVLQPAASGLVIASPFTWLSRDNRRHLETLLGDYAQGPAPATVLVLEGEDEDFPAPPADLPPGPVMTLRLAEVRTALSPSFGVVGPPAAAARFADTRVRLRSPCLVEGANGQGKSLLAKILARAVAFDGRAEVGVGDGPGTVRLLFQDVMTQTLLRDARSLCAAADAGALESALEAEFCRRRGRPPEAGGAPACLRRVKTVLAAVRLVSRPAVLILDEPDWGLSRQDAVALVQALIDLAHRQGTAVMLISHKSWWPALGASVLKVARRRGDREPGLRIQLEASP